MRRSCRLSTKLEHQMLKQAEAEAADAASAEAAAESALVYPSTVTKAIAGLATPALPSPSIFPEDWRMVEELLQDGQPHDGQPQPLCPIKLFADMDEECGQQCGDIDGLAPLLAASAPDSVLLEADVSQRAQPCQEPPFYLADSMQVPMSFSQLLTEAEVELAPDASSKAAPIAAPGSHDAFTASQHGLPELSGSLDDVGLDCEGLDDLMWDELEDLGLDDTSQSGLACLDTLEVSAMVPTTAFAPSQAGLLPLPPSTYRLTPSARAVVPFNASSATTAAMPTIMHLAGQHSSDSTATVLSTWHQSLPPSVVLQTTTGAPMHQASISSSRLSSSTAVATGSRRTGAATVLPAKKVAKGNKTAPAAGAQASGIQADVSTDATGAGAVAGGQAAAPVKRKRGPYKKRVKKEGEETAAIARKKKMISMMPAVEAFAKRSQQQGAASGQLPVSLPGCHQQGPSKRARFEIPFPSSMPTTAMGALDQEPNPGSVFTANMAASSQAHGFPHAAPHQQQAGGPLAVSQASQQDPPPIVAAPRDFLQAAMQARLLGQSLQAGMMHKAAPRASLAAQHPHLHLPSQGSICSNATATAARQQPGSRPHGAQHQACAPIVATASAQGDTQCQAFAPAATAAASAQTGAHCQPFAPGANANTGAPRPAYAPAVRLQTGQAGLRLPAHKEPHVDWLLHNAARAHASCSRALSQSSYPVLPPPMPAGPTVATASLSPDAVAAPTAAAALPTARGATLVTTAPLPTAAAVLASNATAAHGDKPNSTVCAVSDLASSNDNSAAAHSVHAEPPGMDTSGNARVGFPFNVAVDADIAQPSSLDGGIAVTGIQPSSQPLSQGLKSSQAVPTAQPGIPSQLLAASLLLLRATTGSSNSSLTVDHCPPARITSRFVASTPIATSSSVSSSQVAEAQSLLSHSQGLIPHESNQDVLNSSHAFAAGPSDGPQRADRAQAAAEAPKHAVSSSNCHLHAASVDTNQTAPAVHGGEAGHVLDPAKLHELESLHAAAHAAGLWEESDNDSDSSDSVFSGSGSLNGSGEEGATDSLHVSASADLDELAGSTKSQGEAMLEQTGMRTRNGGSCPCRANPAELQKRKGTKHITMKFLEEGGYFDAPIQAAAQKLQVGVTTLKKICRTAKVERWPFRKRTSIERLIKRTEYFMADGDDLEQKISELQTLLAQRQGLQACQAKDVDPSVKKYRQSMFKRIHMKERERRKAAKAGQAGQAPAACPLPCTAVQHNLPDIHEGQAVVQESQAADE